MTRLRILLIILLVALPAFGAQAQEVPPQIALAINDLSSRVGLPLTLSDFDNWSYVQNFYTNTALGCSFAAGTERPEGISAYTFTLVYQGVSYDYRVAADGSISFPCDPNVAALPVLTAQPSNCPPDYAGFLTPRLNPGVQARLGLGGTANRLREAPGINAPQIGLIQPGSTVNVLDGPSCEEASGIIWWRVDANGTIGWTAEGALPGDYFLTPVGSSLPAERNLITLGNADTLIPLATITASGVNSIAFPQDGSLLALGGRSGLAVYEMATLNLRTAFGDVSTPVMKVTFSPDRRYLAYSTMDGRLLLLDLTSSSRTQLTNPANDRHDSLSFSPGHRYLLASGGGAPLSAVLMPPMWRFYELPSGGELLSQETDDWVRAVAFNLDGTLFAWMDGEVHVIDLENGVAVGTFALETPPLGGLVWRPAPVGEIPPRALAFVDGESVRLVDLDASTEQEFLGDEGFLPQAIAFSPNGALLAVMDVPADAAGVSTVNLFDAETGDLLSSTQLPASRDLSFSPDGTLLVIASGDEVVLLGVDADEVPAVG